MFPPPASCRLYVILARDGRSAIVFRRGPSRQVALLRWWLGSDKVELGQWFKGRIYERRCDLSPDGKLLVYFAAKWSSPMATWTAVSRPPFLTALALWPKGDAWGGGGLFEGPRQLGLNHPPDKMTASKTPPMPPDLRVARYADYAGAGEDNPVLYDREQRSGWQLVTQGVAGPYSSKGYAHWSFSTPERCERPQPPGSNSGAAAGAAASGLVLRRDLVAIGEFQGRWYVEHFAIRDERGAILRDLGACDWADWQATGDLLIASDGKLWRLPARSCAQHTADAFAGARLVADLAPLKFAAIEPPAAARTWPGSGRHGYLAGTPLPHS